MRRKTAHAEDASPGGTGGTGHREAMQDPGDADEETSCCFAEGNVRVIFLLAISPSA